jgi:hypothetical protein
MARGNDDIDQIGADVRQGVTHGTKFQCADGTFTTGNLLAFLDDGTNTDSGILATSAAGLFVMCHYLEGAPTASEPVWSMNVPTSITTAQFLANFAGSSGHCATNPTASAVYTLTQNGTSIGTCTISTSGTFSFATVGGTAKTLSGGDLLQVIAPSSVDATLASVNITWFGTR